MKLTLSEEWYENHKDIDDSNCSAGSIIAFEEGLKEALKHALTMGQITLDEFNTRWKALGVVINGEEVTVDPDEPREWTVEEIRTKIMHQIWVYIDYWEHTGENKRHAVEGMTHSLLAMFDGATLDLPGFAIVPQPHKLDKEYHINEGENWFPEAPEAEICDVGGGLHEILYSHDPRRKKASID